MRGCRSHGFAQRAYRPHILLSIRPRQAPGLGRVFAMEGVSFLPRAVDRAQTADRWRLWQRLRGHPETGVPDAEVWFFRAGAAAGARPGGRVPEPVE